MIRRSGHRFAEKIMRNQTSTERDRSPPSKKLRRFRRNSRGSAAVEFAIVAPLFFGLLFAIIA